jgi:hypothetical protein
LSVVLKHVLPLDHKKQVTYQDQQPKEGMELLECKKLEMKM